MTARDPIVAKNGVVSAGDPLAASVALQQLAAGGNAMDAALAASAVQCVVEMPWCGLGGDLFMLVHMAGETSALNGSGRAPLRIGEVVPQGETAPRFGPASMTVPGLPRAWQLAAERYASRPFGELIAPAISYAANGFPAYHRLVQAVTRLKATPGSAGPGPALAAFLGTQGRLVGEPFRQPDLAHSLELLARNGPGSFYDGPLAAAVVACLRDRGVLTEQDFANHTADWEAPLQARYRDCTVVEHPPVSLGCVLLQELLLLEATGHQITQLPEAERIDLLVRCKEAAFEDATELGDPDFVPDRTRWLLSEERISWWIDRLQKAPTPHRGSLLPAGSDTTSTVIADGDGNIVCLIQSLFNEWGSRELVPGTGILLNDRLANTRAVEDQPNGLRGGKRPMHTLNSYLVMREGQPILAGATPGGMGQVQFNLQVLVNILDLGMNIQQAIDQPRWMSGAAYKGPGDRTLYLEPQFSPATIAELVAGDRPVEVVESDESGMFGNCTVIARDRTTGALQAAADSRRYGAAVGW